MFPYGREITKLSCFILHIYYITYIKIYVTCIFIYHIYIHINTHVDVVNIIVHIKTFTFKTEYWDSDCGLSSGLVQYKTLVKFRLILLGLIFSWRSFGFLPPDSSEFFPA